MEDVLDYLDIIDDINKERCLQDMPYVILYGIFSRVPKDKLTVISKLCSRFRDVIGDARLWKDVYIQYQLGRIFDFEELCPWPVKVIDMNGIRVNPPVSSDIVQVIKVTTLDLSEINVDAATIEAILAKYQCAELKLEYCYIDQVRGVAPKAFSKQSALEVLSLRGIWTRYREDHVIQHQCDSWLSEVLSNCKNLKTLDLSHILYPYNFDMTCFVKKLPASLEKLNLINVNPGDSFFNLLAETTPNLRHLELDYESVKCPFLVKFQFLETLCVMPDFSFKNDLFIYFIKFPALKTVYIIESQVWLQITEDEVAELRNTLESYGIGIKLHHSMCDCWLYPREGNHWKVN